MHIELFKKLIESIELIDNKKKKIEEILSALDKIDDVDMNLYQSLYFKGYLWYLMPDESDTRDKMIEKNLLKSIELNQEYLHSKVQLSYFYFDKGKYFQVISLLSKIDISFFEENGQLWKSVKLQELLFISRLSLSKTIDHTLISEFLMLVSVYSNVPSEELAVPIELVESIINNSNKKNIEKLAFACINMVNSRNQSQFFDSKTRNSLQEIIDKSIVDN